jgi:hypothetical protein
VIDDQLAPSIEEIDQRLLAARPVEAIRLGDLLPRQLATLPAELVVETSELLLLGQEFRPLGDPLLV